MTWQPGQSIGATMEQMEALAKNLRALLEASGMTQTEASVRMGIQPQTLANWTELPPVRRIKKNKLAMLAAFFGVGADWLLEPHGENAAALTMRRRADGPKPVREMVARLREAEESNLVRAETCRGCRYYGYLDGWAGARCCDYTVITGKIKHNPPGTCEVRQLKPRAQQQAETEAQEKRRQENAEKKEDLATANGGGGAMQQVRKAAGGAGAENVRGMPAGTEEAETCGRLTDKHSMPG